MLNTIMTHHAKKSNTFVPAKPPQSDPTANFVEYLEGQRKYMRRFGPDTCSNQHQLRGYVDARCYEAEAVPFTREM